MKNIKEIIFIADVAIHYILLIGVIWSLLFPEKRIWPPPKKASLQYSITWLLFYIVVILNVLLVVMDWDTWIIPNEIRFIIGIPIAAVGAFFVTWGIINLGIKNTYGLKNGFISSGAYQFTRNPQYLGDTILFIGISLISNSLYVLVVHLLMILVFAIVPLIEEVWLEDQYGEIYNDYKRNTSRFL